MGKLISLLSIVFLFGFDASAQWNVQQIGSQPGGKAMDIELEDGRNDGVQRVYVSSSTGRVYEWSYNGGSWSNTVVADGKHAGLINMALGNGRNDGNNYLYFNEHTAGGGIYEMVWNGSSWTENLVAAMHASVSPTSITVGDGRGDGVGRLYVGGHHNSQAGGSPFSVTEYTWTGSTWATDTVMTINYSESDGVIGDARGDGKNRLYILSKCPMEADFNNVWSYQNINTCPSNVYADAFHIGDGRNDGEQRLYSNSEAGGKVEFTWNGSSWDPLNISMKGGRADIHLAALRADALNRLYITGSIHWTGNPPSSDLVEYEWNSGASNWDSVGIVVDAVTGATGWVASGNGRNDDTIRLYAPEFTSGKIYEITADNPNVSPITNVNDIVDIEINLYPNPVKDNVLIKLNSKADSKAELSISNILGEVFYVEDNMSTNGNHSIDLSGMPVGIYIVKISSNGYDHMERLIKE